MMVIGLVMFLKTVRKRKYVGWISLFVFGGAMLGLSFVFATPGKTNGFYAKFSTASTDTSSTQHAVVVPEGIADIFYAATLGNVLYCP